MTVRIAVSDAFKLVGVALLAIGCGRKPATLERHEETRESPKTTLDGVWRSVESPTAFRLLPEKKADFSTGQRNELYSADYSIVNDRLRIEIATPTARTVENFLIRKDHLEHESSGDAYFKEDDFFKRWLGATFEDRSAIAVPTPGESFFIQSDQQDVFKPEEHTFGTAYLQCLRNWVRDQVVLSTLKSLGSNQWRSNAEEFQCDITPEANSLPKAKNIRSGLIAIQWGAYEIQSIEVVGDSNATQDIKIVTGSYRFIPNALGERAMAALKEELRSEYKFKAVVKAPRTISEQPSLSAWDWGYIDEEGYETKRIK